MSADTSTLAAEAPVQVAAAPAGDGAAARAVPWPEIWAGLIGLSAVAATGGLLARGSQGHGLFVPVLCLGMVALAAGFDAAWGRVPNALTYPGIILGLLVNGLGAVLQLAAPRLADHWLGAAGPTQALLGFVIIGGIGLVSWLVRGMGGGDMKMIVAIGAMLGLSAGGDVLLCALAVAVVYSLANLAVAGRLNIVTRAAMVQVLNAIYLHDLTPTAPMPRRRIPVALPILIGLLLSRVPQVSAMALWLRGA